MPSSSQNRRISRKELRQPDEFQTFVEAAGNLVADNLLRVILGVGGFLIIVFIIVGVSAYFGHQRSLIAESFYQATAALDHKDYKTAAAMFVRIADEHPGDSLGRLAGFYAGNAYLAEGQTAKARDQYRRYLDSNDRPIFRAMALMQLGVADENLGDIAAAKKAYQDAAALQGPEQERADLNVARLMAQQGDKKGAIAAYQAFLREHPFSQDRAIVIDALANLGTAPPAQTAHLTGTPPIPAAK